MMTARVSSLILLYCRGYPSLSALSSVSTFDLLVRFVLLRLTLFFLFSLSFSLALDRLIICLFSLLQKADSLLI